LPKPLLQIIVASTRPGRVGLPVARWFQEVADRHDAFDVEWVDLAVVGLPLLDEPNHPIARKYTQPHTIAWSETVERGDAFVIVHPEYNHSYNAAIKNALDFLHAEWNYKPVGFVSYGGISAGVRAMTALKPVVAALRMTPVIEAVNVPFVKQFIDDDGRFVPNGELELGAAGMLAELAKLEGALRPLRTATPG
jgi:NAD(P)H-dependent FMN reductase